MPIRKRGGPLNPEKTRNSIVQAALLRLAERGPEGVSFSDIARLAGVDRGTAHRHFENREELLRATAKLVSDRLIEAVFGDRDRASKPIFEAAELLSRNERLIDFAMDNPELCRVWLFEVLSSEDPSSDPFWRAFVGSYQRFAATNGAQANLNTEVLAIIMLASTFLWPVWVRAHAKNEAERRKLALGFSNECMRLSMYGSLKPELFPEIARHLQDVSSGDTAT